MLQYSCPLESVTIYFHDSFDSPITSSLLFLCLLGFFFFHFHVVDFQFLSLALFSFHPFSWLHTITSMQITLKSSSLFLSLFFNSHPHLLTWIYWNCPACSDVTSKTTWTNWISLLSFLTNFLLFLCSLFLFINYYSFCHIFSILECWLRFFTLLPSTFSHFQSLSFVITIDSHLTPFSVCLLSCGFWFCTFKHSNTYEYV